MKTSIAITIITFSILLFLIYKNKKRAFYFLIKRRKVILIIFISILISSLYTTWVNSKYEKVYEEIPQNIQTIATIVSEAKETEYYYSYEVKAYNKKFIMYVKKNTAQDLKYGMSVKLEAEYKEPQESRNYKGFNYKEYLKTKKVYGSLIADKITIIKENDVNIILQYSNIARNKIIKTAKDILPSETQGLVIGTLIGETEGITDEISEAFNKSSLSHIVAISGSHITYIVIGLSFLLTKSKISRKIIHIITILGLILFMFITRFSPTVVRACIMGIIMLFSKVAYRKLDVLNSIALSLLIILIDNPFSIKDVGLELSYLGTLGIIYLNKPILAILKKYINKKIAEILSVTISAQIAVLPITIVNFNTFSTVFIISNLIAVPLSGVIILLGYANVFIGMVSLEIGKIIAIILHSLVEILIWTAKITAQIPYSSIIVITPSVIFIVIYYIILFSFCNKKSQNIALKIYYKIKEILLKPKKVLIIFAVITLIIIITSIIPKDLIIHFIDVGQRR